MKTIEFTKKDTYFLANDVYDYLMENGQNMMNMVDEFPNSWVDCEKSIIYLARDEDKPIFKITVSKI